MKAAAKAESPQLNAAAEECEDESRNTRREAHLKEVDAAQALLASLELFERRREQGRA